MFNVSRAQQGMDPFEHLMNSIPTVRSFSDFLTKEILTMTLRNDFINDLISVIGDDKSIKAGIICKSGGRSSATVAMLKEKGYKNIYNMTEGIVGDETKTGWITRGYPIASCESECN